MSKYSLILIPLILAACSNEPMMPAPEKENISGKPAYFKIGEEQALNYADNYFTQVFKDDKTRAQRRDVKSIEFIGNKTRSTESDGWYLINYEDNAGYAVISSDSRIDPVLAISEEGNLSMADTLSNPGLLLFFRNVKRAIDSVCINDETNKTRFEIEPRPGTDTIQIIAIQPAMLASSVQQWHQSAPFNNFCPVHDGEPTLAGCGPVAVGQMMTYYEYPSSKDGVTLNWNAIKSSNLTQNLDAARLLHLLGGPNYLGTQYSTVNSLTLLYRIEITIGNWGYGWPVHRCMTNLPNMYEDLLTYGPVVIYGAEQINGPNHIWVIDGCSVTVAQNAGLDPVTGPYDVRSELYHCVWGWGGNGNGYFNWSPVSGNNDQTHLGIFLDLHYYTGFQP